MYVFNQSFMSFFSADIAAYVSFLRSAPSLLTALGELSYQTTAIVLHPKPSSHHTPSSTHTHSLQAGGGRAGEGSELYTLEKVRSMTSRMNQNSLCDCNNLMSTVIANNVFHHCYTCTVMSCIRFSKVLSCVEMHSTMAVSCGAYSRSS